MNEICLTNEQEREVESKVKEVLVTLQKITHHTNRISELEDALQLNHKHTSTSNNIMLVLLVVVVASQYFFDGKNSVGSWMIFLLINMGMLATWTQLKFSKEIISSQIDDAIFNRKLLEMDVAKESLLKVQLKADYLDYSELEKAEAEVRDYLSRKYK
jgi:hypothetical protein